MAVDYAAMAKKYGGTTESSGAPASGGSKYADIASKYGAVESAAAPVAASPNTGSAIVDTAANVGIGFAKKANQTLFSLSALNDANPVNREMLRNAPALKKTVDEVIKPSFQTQGTAQAIGGGIERVAEFLAPVGAIRKGETAINALIQGTGFGARAARVGSKAALEGGVGTVIGTAQAGGDLKEGLKTGAFMGALKGVTGAAGETAKAFKLPERIYSMIFKNSYKDVLEELKTSGKAVFQKTHPEEYAALVKAGVIKTGTKGEIIINETLAKQALDRGLKGSWKNMANTTVQNLFRTEAAVQNAAKKAKGKVDVSEKQFAAVLKQAITDFKHADFGAQSKAAKEMLTALKKGKGKLNAEDALKFRRLLYKMIRPRSFDAPAASNISMTQQQLKFLANTLRTRLNKVPGMAKSMDDYVFNIEALEHIAKGAQRSGNNQLVGMIDSILFTGGTLASPAAGGLLAVGRRVLSSPRVATNIAQGVQNSGQLTKLGQSAKALVTNLLLAPEAQ